MQATEEDPFCSFHPLKWELRPGHRGQPVLGRAWDLGRGAPLPRNPGLWGRGVLLLPGCASAIPTPTEVALVTQAPGPHCDKGKGRASDSCDSRALSSGKPQTNQSGTERPIGGLGGLL